MSKENDSAPSTVRFPEALGVLRAAAEETRLRILALLAEGELSVSDLTDILGQSQPRISRHLKLLVEAGLIERHREGAWAFFRMREGGGLVEPLIARLETAQPPLSEDRARLDAVRAQRAEAAQAFFARLAPKWDGLRSLHVPEAIVEAAVLDLLGPRPVGSLIDLGTGTGKMLALLAPRAARATGLDSSHAMLSVARANLEQAGLSRIELRQGDIHAPPFGRGSFDLVVVHQVLHYLDDPARALRGDPAEGVGHTYRPHPGGYATTADLVAGIKRIGDFKVSVSAYPEKHPEAASLEADIDALKAKVDAGADQAITQFFFENDIYLRYLDKVRAAGIEIPIIPGILPVQNFKQAANFARRTGASVPYWLAARFEGLDDDVETRRLVAAAVAAEQVIDLVDAGISDFHFYSMNRSDLVYAICHILGLRSQAPKVAAAKAA